MKILRAAQVSWLVIMGWANVGARGGEAVAVAGILEKAPAGQFFSTHFLRDPNSGGLIAGLRDPGDRLWTAGTRVTLMAETTFSPDVNGLPILRVVSLLPEYWAQPSIWFERQRLPGSFTSHPKGPKPKDFAGTPFTTYRAYQFDNGLERLRWDAPSETETPRPLQLTPGTLNADGFVWALEGYAGLSYEIQHTASLNETAQTISVLTPPASGPLTISAPRQGAQMGFYFLRAVPLIAP